MKTVLPFNSWITCPNPNPEVKLRLFCFHYAGGGALSFRMWMDRLSPWVEVCPIELPGRGIRLMEPPFNHIEPLTQALAQALSPNLTKPFALFGHSMGALVSFELARLLWRKHRLSPIHLFVSGHRAPQIPDPDPPIHALPDSTFIEELRRYNGTPEDVLNNTELMQLLLPTLRADFAVVETYSYTHLPPLDCPITAFGGMQDWKASYDDLVLWCKQTTDTFSLKMFPGDHFFLHSAQTLLFQSLTQKLSLQQTIHPAIEGHAAGGGRE